MTDEKLAQIDKTGYLRRAKAALEGHPIVRPKPTESMLVNFLGFGARRRPKKEVA